MKDIKLIGLDLAKNYFQLHGVDGMGKVVLKKQLKRNELAEFIIKLKPCRIAMESCASSQYWARKFKDMGHEVDLIAPQFVKPFVKSQKNDAHDAEAIAEAAQRPNMRYVSVKSLEKQDIQSLHKSRSLVVETRIALVNHVRGLLLEYGVALSEGYSKFRSELFLALEDAESELTDTIRSIVHQIWEQIESLEKTVKEYEARLQKVAKENSDCQRLMEIPGVGIMVSTHFFSSVANPQMFKNGRQCSAWLGLVPKQFSSGGKTVLGGITKRGDTDLRNMLYQGSASVVVGAKRYNKTDPLSQWALKLWKEKGFKKAVIAVENKLCRVMWHILASKEEYQNVMT